MPVWLWIVLVAVWIAIAVPCALVFGKSIRLGDQAERGTAAKATEDAA